MFSYDHQQQDVYAQFMEGCIEPFYKVAFPFSLDLGFQYVKDRFCGDSARHILECQERFDMDVAVRRF